MKRHYESTGGRNRVSRGFTAVAVLTLATAACADPPTGPPDPAVSTSTHAASFTTAALIQFPGFEIPGSPTGDVRVRRRANGTLHWKLEAAGLAPGHAYTVWLLNGADPLGTDGGHVAGGVVGGNGRIVAAGNGCVSDLANDGFAPGSGKDCDMIDATGGLTFALIDHDEWTPGDMSARWSPFGGGFNGFMFVTFVAD